MAAEDIAFVSLGMVVLDELHLGDGTVLYDVPGGSGLYSEYVPGCNRLQLADQRVIRYSWCAPSYDRNAEHP
jgi:hypothetical protein